MGRFIFLFVLFAVVAPSAADDVARGKVTALAQVNSPWDRHWDYFKAKIDESPDVEMEYYIRGEVGTEEQMLTALRRNRIQIGGVTMWGLAGIIPESAVPMIPFLFESTEEVDFVFDNYLQDLFTDFLAERGLVFMDWSEVGWSNLYANTPVLTPADADGLKIRGSPNFAAQAFLQSVGADSIPLGTADIAPALQTGLVDGGLSSMVFFYYALSGFATDVTETHQSYDQGVQMANKQWWDTLSTDQKNVIKGAFFPIVPARADVRELIKELRLDLVSRGLSIHSLTADQRAQWVEATAPSHRIILDEIGGRADEVYAAIQEGKRAFADQSTAID
ncbi:MAG: TRAP transporter substrate-binding protein [Rhodospirillaceae bacterium]|nr:TRAP transporter substrate-binding protein [Rhodospirillaceae bacterium]MBT5242171.1 TRAP transporter substrate-binding protein [Rhodospirillaceae bacterium]MBT5565899.1 TRAP transporter substrate-binding protein [Rhodospirillaceae bacterium]MBT6088681.1 TRAP transporter substrate-binding protein [Rhodospirillaceae bacterium]MBT7450532.1 TRAP transporter substrate-binding protein [Rhodospirillaceae bacterium]